MRHLRSLPGRMVLSHVLIATLASSIAALIVAVIVTGTTQEASLEYYRYLARLTIAQWQFNDPDGQPNVAGLPPGFGVVVAPDDQILISYGDTVCRAGMALHDCAPELVGRTAGARFFTRDSQRWAEVVQPTVTGQRAIVQYGPRPDGPSIIVGGVSVTGTVPFLLTIAGTMLLISIPLSLAMAWIWVRPLMRRVARLAQVSRQFAAGELAVRVNDHNHDEIGGLAQQFDAMADTLALNVSVLRDLAERNAQLAHQTEQSAILAERARLSRDLHDELAQQLFSLSISAATLPDAIQHDQAHAAQQAEVVARQAEQTLISLRSVLIELRPDHLVERGLAAAIQDVCTTWQAAHGIAVQCSVVLTGKRLGAGVEDVLYRSTQEALNNVAKHAGARSVALALVEGQRQITLSITDDGIGFDQTRRAASGHVGIISMYERARAVGGCLEIESESKRGTTLRMTLPLDRTVAGA